MGRGWREFKLLLIVSGLDLTKDEVVYQVFISPTEQGRNVFEDIKNHLLTAYPIFNITLGVANFGASITEVYLGLANTNLDFNPNTYSLIYSAIPTKHVEDLKFDKEDFGSYNFVEEDMMLGDFVANNNREVRRMNRLLFSTSANPLRVKLNTPSIKMKLPEGETAFQFMDA